MNAVMKRKKMSIVLFIAVFSATYLFLSFGIPGLRTKLEAAPLELFLESIKSIVVFKFIVSLVMAIIIRVISLLIEKKNINKSNVEDGKL